MRDLLQTLTYICKKDERKARWRVHVAICESKRRFATLRLAKRRCKAIMTHDGKELEPYKCKVCNQFHLSSR